MTQTDTTEHSLAQGEAKAKAPSAFRTIGEVAAELGVPPHVLRFWESKFTEIKPHKRRGGHRYYRPADIDLLHEIKSLLYSKGYTIKGAQKHLKDVRDNKEGQASMFTEQDDAMVLSSPQGFTRKETNSLKKILNGLEDVRQMLDHPHAAEDA